MRSIEKVEAYALGCFSLLLYPFTAISDYLFSPEAYRYMKLDAWADKALRKGDYEKATALALEYLQLARRFKDWNYGNAIHDGHQILGLICLRQGNIQGAKEHLILAGRTPGSPQLNSFGPRMTLARELLLKGEKDVVLKYLNLVGRFWANEKKEVDPDVRELKRRNKALLQHWKIEINKGTVPYDRTWY